MEIPINAEVKCKDGVCGRSTYIIVNPVSRQITHVVVKLADWPHTERLVPIELVRSSGDNTLELDCTCSHLVTLQHLVDTQYVREPYPNPVSPGALPMRMLVPKEIHRIPKGELAVQKGAHKERMMPSPKFKMVAWLALAVVALTLAACAGSASGAAANAPTPVQINLSEFKIDSSLTTFAVNTPYRFVIKNTGSVAHEWMIMPRGETDVSKALVEVGQDQLTPGTTVIQDFTFAKPGEYEFACHMAGHYEAGMKLDIVVK